MSVVNIRHTFLQTLPDTFDPIANFLDNFTFDKRPRHSIEAMQGVHLNSMIEKNGKHISEKYFKVKTKVNTLQDPPTPDRNFARYDTNKSIPSDNLNNALLTLVSDFPPLLSVIPNDNNTVISLVSIGGLVETFTVQRCIRSIRKRGMFTGHIILFTDNDGNKRYQDTILFLDNQTIVIHGREEDLYPREQSNNGQGMNQTEPPLKKYAQKSIVFKRFKTLHSKYIARYLALSDSIWFVVYVDVDNIIGSRMDIFFEDYTRMVADGYQKAISFHRNFTSTASDAGKLVSESNKRKTTTLGS